jgi:hypothetical protein
LYGDLKSLWVREDQRPRYKASRPQAQLSIVQWLWEVGGADVHACKTSAFQDTCRKLFNVAQWLWSLGGVNVHADKDNALKTACIFEQWEMARWILSLGDPEYSWPVSALSDLKRWSKSRST